MMAGYHFDLGGMCRLVINGVDVIVASQPQQVFDGEPFFLHGIDITRCRVVAIKGANHYRAGLSPLAANIISVDADGLCSTDIISFPRKHLEQPVWPLTEEVQFAGTAELSSHAPW
jgi:toxic protein SymE